MPLFFVFSIDFPKNGYGTAVFSQGLFLGCQITEIIADDGLNQFSTSGRVPIAAVNTCKVHENDAGGAG